MKKLLAVLIFILILAGNSYGLTGEDIVRKSQNAFFYPGKDFKARVVMRLISRTGKQRIRELTMLRKNYGDEQKYFIYFFRPSDVRGMTFMVYKYPGRDDDRWLFVPAINMVRRIAAQDKRSSFVGSDFTYEDVSGRDVEEDTHELLKKETLQGRNCYVVKSTPKAGDMDYSYKLSWVDETSFLPIKEQYYDRQGELYRVFTADEIKDIDGIPTVTKRTMKDLQSGHRTEVTFTEVHYNIGIDDSLFTERYLRRPPRKWIK
jgi:outer membrane lipoprotein-sorting protein